MRLQFRSPALLAATMLACAICVTAPSRADTVVFDGTDSGLFGRLDLNTGVFTQTATLTAITPAGLAEVGSALYTADYTGTAFYRLNPVSGAVTQISNIGLDGNPYAGLGSSAVFSFA
jgi:hypothetical protein